MQNCQFNSVGIRGGGERMCLCLSFHETARSSGSTMHCPELFNIKLVEANYKEDSQMRAIKELVEAEDPDLEKKNVRTGSVIGTAH